MSKRKQIQFYDVTDKTRMITDDINYMFVKTMSMFRYTNLPDTIPKRCLERLLQYQGFAVFIKHNDNLYALYAGLGGEPNANFEPTLAIIANPALNISKEFTIDTDCVVMRNDSYMLGLLPISERYASLLCENTITMRMTDINMRGQSLISATDDRTLRSAKAYIDALEAGKQEAVASSEFFDSLAVSPYATPATANTMTACIELQQYLRASWNNDLGLNSNYNMKREAITANESQLNEDMLEPLVDDMLACRKEAVEKINVMFGTNITVELASAWRDDKSERSDKDTQGGEKDDDESEDSME